MNWIDTTHKGPSNKDHRSIDWMTSLHRSRSRKTTVSGKSKCGRVMSHHFTNSNMDVDMRVDAEGVKNNRVFEVCRMTPPPAQHKPLRKRTGR